MGKGKHEPGRGKPPMRIPDTRNYEGKHGKGCMVAAIMMGLIMVSPFAGAAYALMTH